VTDLWTSDGPKFVQLDQLLDAVSTGPRWLERHDVACVVANALSKGVRESRYELDAWVLMPNHVHILLRPLGDQDLGSAVKSIKGSSAHAANQLLHRSGSRFWARDYFDRRIRDRDHQGRVTRYIENNPVKAGLCGSVEDWPWSSAGKNAAEAACTE
jgi:REP element-mobilizing transposase RayT